MFQYTKYDVVNEPLPRNEGTASGRLSIPACGNITATYGYFQGADTFPEGYVDVTFKVGERVIGCFTILTGYSGDGSESAMAIDKFVEMVNAIDAIAPKLNCMDC